MCWVNSNASYLAPLALRRPRPQANFNTRTKIGTLREAQVDIKTDELGWEAQRAKVRATALYYLALHLRGGEQELDLDLEEF